MAKKTTDEKIDDLSAMMTNGFARMEKTIDEKIDELIIITVNGFRRIEERLENIIIDIGEIKKDIAEIKQDIAEMITKDKVFSTQKARGDSRDAVVMSHVM